MNVHRHSFKLLNGKESNPRYYQCSCGLIIKEEKVRNPQLKKGTITKISIMRE